MAFLSKSTKQSKPSGVEVVSYSRKHGKLSNASFKDNLQFWILAIPAIVYFVVFAYIPMFGLTMAFQEFQYGGGFFGNEFIGFRNFELFFVTQDFGRIIRNTLAYSSTFIVLGLVVQVAVSLLLFEISRKVLLKFYQTTMLLPNFLSWVIVGFFTYILFNPRMGVIGSMLEFIGVIQPGDFVDWYADPRYWPFILTFTNIWRNVGMGSLIYYAALTGIDAELYEAAKIDGASKWKQAKHISIPSLIPMMTILSILAIGGLFRGDFGLFFQIPRDVGILYPATDIIDTYIYRGLIGGNFGEAAAVGMIQSLVGLFLVIVANTIVRKINPENSLF